MFRYLCPAAISKTHSCPHFLMKPPIYFELFNNHTNTIIVWDNGKGIDPAVENTLFEPFVTEKETGRGLGLYITQEL